MIKFKINGKDAQIATSWDELNYHQFYQTFNIDGTILQLVSIASGTDYEFIKKVQLTGDVDKLVIAMTFFKKPAVWDKPVLSCGPYGLPINHDGQYDITYASLAQFEDMRAAMGKLTGETQSERVKSIAGLYPTFVAIYLQKIRDGEYSYNKAMEMVEEIKSYPAREVVTLGSFFLVKLTNLLNGTPDSSPTTPQNLKKKKQDSAGSKKHSGRSPRSRK